MEQELLEYIMNILPAITAILTAIGALIAVFVQGKRLLKRDSRDREFFRSEMRATQRENAELKRDLSKVMKFIYRVRDDGESE